MKQKCRVALFALGAILMSAPGLCTEDLRWAFAVFLGAGFVILVTATVWQGGSKPAAALVLLISTNLSFWLSYGLWRLRLKYVGPSPNQGIDVFAGPVALWSFVLLACLLYEVVVFVRALAKGQQRMAAVAGLLAWVIQVLITLGTVWGLLEGV